MKKNLLSAMLLMLALTACEQDVYDKGDNAYSYVRADFVEAVVGSNCQVSYVVTDDGERLTLNTPYAAKWITRADTTYRAVLFYDYSGEKVEARSLSRVSTVSIRKPAQFSTGVKTDPVGLESVWLSGNRKYLNMSVILKTGDVNDEEKVQTLGMVGDTITVGADGLRTCQVRLFHNQGDVPEYYSQRLYFSVPLAGLEADSIRLSVNTYNGVVTKGLRL